jgi:hypothetical protein
LVSLPDAADVEAKLAEQLAFYTDNTEELNQWFALFGTLVDVRADQTPELVADCVSAVVENCIAQREAKIMQAQEAEKQQAVFAAEEARVIPALEAAATTSKSGDAGASAQRPASSNSKIQPVQPGRETSSIEPKSLQPVAQASDLSYLVPLSKEVEDPANIIMFADIDLARLLASQWIRMERQFTARSRGIFRALRMENDSNLTYFATTRRQFFQFLRRPNKMREDLLQSFQVIVIVTHLLLVYSIIVTHLLLIYSFIYIQGNFYYFICLSIYLFTYLFIDCCLGSV